MADLTADQVWQCWQERAAGQGLTPAAETAARDGSVLRLAGVSVAPLGGTQFDIAQTVLTEAADGSVAAAFPDRVAITFEPGDSMAALGTGAGGADGHPAQRGRPGRDLV
ncbi:MAG: hypothetical protein ACK4GO_15295 [Gemmobacter sp.]